MNKYILQIHTSKMANYLKNLLIMLLIFELVYVLSFVGYIVFVVFLAVITMCSMGLLLINDSFRGLWNNLDNFSNYRDKLIEFIPIANIVAIGVCVVAIAITCGNLQFQNNKAIFWFAIVNLVVQIAIFVSKNLV